MMLKLSEIKLFTPFVVERRPEYGAFILVGTLKTSLGISYLMFNLYNGYAYLEANMLEESELVIKSPISLRLFLLKILDGLSPEKEVMILFSLAYGKDFRENVKDFN